MLRASSAGSARSGDVLGRIGGDEFGLLLPETNAEQARSIAERWARDFRAAPVGVAADLTMSVGVCDLIHAGGSRELLRLADNALYHAKTRGRDTIVIYSPDAVPDISDTDRADRLERMQAFTAIRSLARLIDAKEPMAEHHSERVAAFVQPLAEAAGWPLGRIAELADAALIHDVGKISVPDYVLCKPAALTPAEYEMIKPHAALGAQMANDCVSDEQSLWIAQHHERFDGAGYPNGLADAQITEGAALLALADSWDVMTTERRYSPPRPEKEALADCLSLAGAQFSPAACQALAAVM